MSNRELHDRLSRISTVWDQLRQVHSGSANEMSSAMDLLVERYGGAVYRYLLAVVRDPAVAQDLRQEFVLRMVRGDFHKADPEKGRFRHYVKAVLFNLVRRFKSQEAKRPTPVDPVDFEVADADSSVSEADRLFQESWRDQLLSRTWDSLSQSQPQFYEVLRFRADHPNLPSEEMAAQLGGISGNTTTASGVRQTLKRARKRFAELLIEQIAHSLQRPSPEEIEEELAALDLLEYCRPALA